MKSKGNIKIWSVLTEADSGGSILVAVCATKDKALELIKEGPGLDRTDFFLEEVELGVPVQSYQHYWEK